MKRLDPKFGSEQPKAPITNHEHMSDLAAHMAVSCLSGSVIGRHTWACRDLLMPSASQASQGVLMEDGTRKVLRRSFLFFRFLLRFFRLQVGNRCEVNPGGKRGEVRYIGKVPAAAPGWWVGVQYDEPVGKNNGSIMGQRYFECVMI